MAQALMGAALSYFWDQKKKVASDQ